MTGPQRWSSGRAYVFPGQGSQYPGMGRELSACPEPARTLVPRAEEATGLPVDELMNRADAKTIASPDVAQLLVFLLSTAYWHKLEADGQPVDVVAGHSLGEYSALVASGSLTWEEALGLVAARGRAMAEAAEESPGAMGAIVGLGPETVEQLCSEVSQSDTLAVPANVNSPKQVAVSGDPSAVTEVMERAEAAGAIRARLLPVGGAYHSPLMADAERRLAPEISTAPLREPRIPFVSSVTGDWVRDVDDYRDVLGRQVTSPVQWASTVHALTDAGVQTFTEVGPGRVLTGLGRELARDARHVTAKDAARRGRAAA